ncbi:hypothetical protein KIN20_029025 [Parelaphostrongylus tenuis]|uniref:Uncharacterized protein n=1 Tax=Parelaphostrongylus tenuis TaxID=148309 RepID=A0AAD5R1N7_PARTN|nr:hypothetical protein KIN20_029025 [Parelaphostrongylus tenuis]
MPNMTEISINDVRYVSMAEVEIGEYCGDRNEDLLHRINSEFDDFQERATESGVTMSLKVYIPSPPPCRSLIEKAKDRISKMFTHEYDAFETRAAHSPR